MTRTLHAPPMALTDADLSEVEGFADRNGLDQIFRICRELRALRQAYMDVCKMNGKLRAQLMAMEWDPHNRYAVVMDTMTGTTDAKTKP